MEGVNPIMRGELAFVVIMHDDDAKSTTFLSMPDRTDIRSALWSCGLTDDEVWEIMNFIREGLNNNSYGFMIKIEDIKKKRDVPFPEMRYQND